MLCSAPLALLSRVNWGAEMNIASLLKPVGLAVALSLFGGAAQSATLTGDPSGPSSGIYCCSPWSTNLDNYLSGNVHHVLLESSDVGEVTLKFVNPTRWEAFFEYRVDSGPSLGVTPHPTIPGTFEFAFETLAPNSFAILTYLVSEHIEIRSAFGVERDWDFDWTKFAATPVPLPGALLLFGSALAGFFGFSKLRKRLSTNEPAAA
jgi:hypothetical protein